MSASTISSGTSSTARPRRSSSRWSTATASGAAPTKPFGRGEEQRAWARLGVDDPHEILGPNATQNPGRGTEQSRRLPPTERRALEILEARDHWTKAEIRKQYRSLVKDLHPDMNGGDRGDEERLQEVVWAWDQIKDSRNFRVGARQVLTREHSGKTLIRPTETRLAR